MLCQFLLHFALQSTKFIVAIYILNKKLYLFLFVRIAFVTSFFNMQTPNF